MKLEQVGTGLPEKEPNNTELRKKVDQDLIEKYGLKFFEKITKSYDSHFRLSEIDHIKVEEKIVDNKGGPAKEFIVSYIAYGDPNESEADFIIKEKLFATIDNNVFAGNSSIYTNFSEENKNL